MALHHYATHLVWQGSTGLGYRAYGRDHHALAPPAPAELALSADPAFRGDPSRLNPEQLLVMAASSCQLLSFLAEAARAGIDVIDYEDDASAVMDDGIEPARFTEIVLAPIITVTAGSDVDQVLALVEAAHHGCYIANSLAIEVQVRATVVCD